MRTKFKAWARPYIEEHPEAMLTIEQIKEFKMPFALEIGSGKGKFLHDLALNNPKQSYIGIERNVTCAGIACKKLVEDEITNAKLMFVNADEVLDALPAASLSTIYLNFSDPWPKKKHHKRRLTAPSYLAKYYRLLLNKGEILIKTDNDDLFAFSVENLRNSPFKIVKIEENYDGQDPLDIPTEYELSFREKGQSIHRIVVKKDD